MKNFNYTARDKTGATKRGSLKALDRNAALHELAAQGMVTLSLMEGAAKNASGLSNMKPFMIAGGIAAVLLAVLALVLLSFKKPELNLHGKEVKKNIVKSQKAVNKPKSIPVAIAKTPEEPKKVTIVDNTALNASTEKEGSKAGVPTVTSPPKPESVEPVDKTLDSETEQLMGMALAVPKGSAMPPLPISPNMDKDFNKAMSNTIVIFETDSENVAEKKEQIAILKLEVNSLVKEGYTPSDIMRTVELQHNEVANMRDKFQEQMITLLRENREEEARVFKEAADKELLTHGAESLKIPKRWQKEGQ